MIARSIGTPTGVSNGGVSTPIQGNLSAESGVTTPDSYPDQRVVPKVPCPGYSDQGSWWDRACQSGTKGVEPPTSWGGVGSLGGWRGRRVTDGRAERREVSGDA